MSKIAQKYPFYRGILYLVDQINVWNIDFDTMMVGGEPTLLTQQEELFLEA